MSTQQLRALVAYRIEQAQETLHEAKILRTAGTLRGSVNRAYYTMFYAALALLATRQVGTSKHSGVLAMFDQEFVKTGLFARSLSRSFHLAFSRRQVNDYGEMSALDEQVVDKMLQDAEEFLAAAQTFLRHDGYL